MNTIPEARTTTFVVVVLSVLLALEWRLVQLQILRHEELEEKAEAYRFASRVEQSWRGQVQDRNGFPLAVTLPVRNVYADLAVWSNRVEQLARVVAPLLDTNAPALAQFVARALERRGAQRPDSPPGALLLKRGITPGEWAGIKERISRETFGFQPAGLSSRQKVVLKRLRRWTLFDEADQQRVFPNGELLAQVLGFVGRGTNGHSLQGRWGIEASLDPFLAGENGLCASSRDAGGNDLAFSRTERIPARDGAHVVLTIDLVLQKIVEGALSNAIALCSPTSASCVVIRPRTGEILAMATLPGFSPGAPGSPSRHWRNACVSERHEVGSVFKAITLAGALEVGAVNLDQRIFCENGQWTYKGIPLHDAGHRYGWLTARECLANSSNIGLAKIGLLLGADRMYYYITRFGFDQPTGIPLPFEVPGFIRPLTNWSGISATRLAIGHELAVTQLELAMAYAAIANDGKLMRPLLVARIDHADGTAWGRYGPIPFRQVIRPETARLLREAMAEVVEHGTGKAAALPEHTTSGKTGTAQKSDGRRYLPGRLYCSFVGMVPAPDPELVIAVALDEPKGNAFGGTVAAPVFREIAEQAVALYNIPPDKPVQPTRARQLIPVRNKERGSLLAAMD